MKPKLKSSKTKCNFNHAILLVIVCHEILLKSVCQTRSQSIITHNRPTYYSIAHNRFGTKFNFFLEEVELWYSNYVPQVVLRTTWVANTHLFTYALIAKLQQKGQIFWSMRVNYSNSNTYSKQLRNSGDSKFWWKSVEPPKLKYFNSLLDKIQRTLKPSHKDIRTTIYVLPCRRKAKQFEAHPILKMLETKTFSNKTKIYYQICLNT